MAWLRGCIPSKEIAGRVLTFCGEVSIISFLCCRRSDAGEAVPGGEGAVEMRIDL